VPIADIAPSFDHLDIVVFERDLCLGGDGLCHWIR